MLQLRIRDFLKSKGIKKPYSYLKKIGLTHHMTNKVLNKKNIRIPLHVISRICAACYCTPNDLFAWEAEPNQPALSDDHPLHKLSKRPAANLLEKISRMTEEEIRELERKIG